MQGGEFLKPSSDQCYFAVRGFDLHGGDLLQKQGFTSEDEAIVAVKGLISGDPSLCGMLAKLKNGTYTIYIKQIRKTNPTKNEHHWDRCKIIFYGTRMMDSKEKRGKICQMMEYPQGLFEYFLVSKFDMNGGDFQITECDNFQQAYLECLQMLDYDASKCGMILSETGKEKCLFFIKNPRKCNPSASENHLKCTSIFVGRQV